MNFFYLCGATQPSAADARGKRSNVNEPLIEFERDFNAQAFIVLAEK